MTTITVLGVDPALANFGMARFTLNMDDLELGLTKLRLVQTDRTEVKTVRNNSDMLRRGQEIATAFLDEVKGVDFVFAEIPSGAKSAQALYGLAMQVGIIACSPAPVIQVMPNETKIATAGKNATKAQMIKWATDLYPSCPDWLRDRGKANGRFINDNEHLADACGIVHAGLLTDEFRRMRTMLMRRAA